MKAIEMNSKLVDSYIALLKKLNTKSKLDLISKLTQSINSEKIDTQSTFGKAFGGWDEKDDVNELTQSIRNSRAFNRNLEAF